jgi:hypothetical protein
VVSGMEDDATIPSYEAREGEKDAKNIISLPLPNSEGRRPQR